MGKKTAAIILEIIPVVSAVTAIFLMTSTFESEFLIKRVIPVTTFLGFLGFAFFFVGRKLAKEYRAVKILGVLDWLATAAIIAFYILVIIAFGM